MQRAMRDTIDASYEDARLNVKDFYSIPGNPTSKACPPPGYDRTGRLGRSARNNLKHYGNYSEGEISLDLDYVYPNNSGRSTQYIYNLAESYGLLGKGGFWEKTEQDIEKNINIEFGKRFSK